MSRRAAICGATWPRTARPTTTSANSSRPSSAMKRRRQNPQQGPMLPGADCTTQGHCAGRAVARGVGRRREQMAVADSADCIEYGDQAGACGALCAEGVAGLQSCDSRSDSRGDFHAAFEGVGWPTRNKAKTRCPTLFMLRLPNDHTSGHTARRADAEGSVCRQRPRSRARSGCDFALAVLGRYGVLHS